MLLYSLNKYYLNNNLSELLDSIAFIGITSTDIGKLCNINFKDLFIPSLESIMIIYNNDNYFDTLNRIIHLIAI